MKAINFIVLILVGFCVSSLSAQTKLSRNLQCFRSGDKLVKQQVTFKDPGRRGMDVLWDFSKLKSINEDYPVVYYEPAAKRGGDSLCITCLENRTMYKYIQKGDSLLYIGFENSGSRIKLDRPEYVLHYPFAYGDSIVSSFKGKGCYKNALSSATEGHLYVVADAVGTLILPDGDTLRNVLRIKMQHEYKQSTRPVSNQRNERIHFPKDSLIIPIVDFSHIIMTDTIESTNADMEENGNILSTALKSIKKKTLDRKFVSNDSIYFRTETYRWYAPGYRYPVFETICNHSSNTLHSKSEKEDIATAFYFPPSMHTYLADDSENQTVLDSLQQLTNESKNNTSEALLFDYNFYPNPVKIDLQVELLLDLPSNVVISVFTISGDQVFRQEEGLCTAGQHSFILNLDKLRLGEYLLNITVNEQTVKSILMKNK